MYSILFAMMILFAAYSAMMTATLSVVKTSMPFEDIVGLYRDTDFKVGSVEKTAFDKLYDVRT